MDNILGKRLRKLREKENLSQKEAAKKFGITNFQLSRYEGGQSNPDPDLIAQFADYYDVTSDFILGLSDHPHYTAKEQEEKLDQDLFEKLVEMYKEGKLTKEDMDKINEYAEFVTREKK